MEEMERRLNDSASADAILDTPFSITDP